MNAIAKPRIRVGTDGRVLGEVSPQTSPQFRAQYFQPAGSGGAAALFAWRPALRDAREDVARSYLEAAARAISAVQNSGWLAGAVDQACASTIGTALRLSPRPDRILLGWDDKTARDWSSLVERRWIVWSNDPFECDAAGKHTIGEQTKQFYRCWFAYGEGIALLPAIQRPAGLSRTKVQIILPHRLSQHTDDLERWFQGVRIDDYGFPLAYRFCENRAAPGHINIRARDGVGRPQVVHIFEGMPGQTRGITPMAPVLRVVRQYDQLADATLTAAMIQAIFAATIESEAPTEQLLQALQDPSEQDPNSVPITDLFGIKAAWYQQTKIDLGTAGRIAHLFPGETLKFNRSEHPNATYEAFSRFLLRECARCLGLTFEEFTGDYNGVTYTGARLGTSANWPIVLSRREAICGRFLQHVYEAWLEEEIESGRIPFPGGVTAFYAQRQAACSADWRGPAKPQPDDLKAAKAHETYKRLGVITDEQICADLGLDVDDVYEQRAREKEMRESLGLSDGDALMPDPAGDAMVTEDAGDE